MATLPDMVLRNDEWELLTESDQWTIQCLQGYACVAWADSPPSSDQFCGIRIYEHRRISGSGKVYGKAGRDLVGTRVSVNEGVQILDSVGLGDGTDSVETQSAPANTSGTESNEQSSASVVDVDVDADVDFVGVAL